MRLDISNFGIIQSASVNIKGLTVICGENDTGKSTVGKLLFAIVKASQKYEDELGEGLIYQIHTYLSRISNLLLSSRDTDYFGNSRELAIFFRNIDPNELLLSKDISQLFKAIDNIDQPIKDQLKEYLSKIHNLLENTPDEHKAKEKALRKAIYSEFKKTNYNSSFISLRNGDDQCIVEFGINASGLHNVVFEKNMQLDDITYIENPFILQFRRMFLNAITLLDERVNTRSWARETVSLHLKDLARKLSILDPNLIDVLDNYTLKELSNRINSLIDGDFYYDDNQEDFILSRNGKTFPSMNIASGIKSLGLVNSLLKGGVINKNSLLILDEPETNLHPKWQNEYAKLICELVKNGIKIITVTHSPYMVSALEHYSKEIKFKNFYWANKTIEDEVIFKDKTFSVMEDIVQKFANNFSELD